MKVTFVHLIHTVSFSAIGSKAISSKYFMYMFAIIGDKGEPIAKSSSCWYIADHNWNVVVCMQNVNVSIRLNIRMLVNSS